MTDIEGKPHGESASESRNGASFKHRLGDPTIKNGFATDEHRSKYSAEAAAEGYPQITQIFADSDKALG